MTTFQITSFLWIRWTIWHWGKVSNFYSMQLLNLDDTIKYCNLAQYRKRSYFTTIDSSTFFFFSPFPFITSIFSPFCKTILMRPYFAKHGAGKANKSASEHYILKWQKITSIRADDIIDLSAYLSFTLKSQWSQAALSTGITFNNGNHDRVIYFTEVS